MLLCYALLEGISAAFSGMNTLVGLYCILYLDTNYKVYMTTCCPCHTFGVLAGPGIPVQSSKLLW